MPTMANVVVKNLANEDVTFTAITGAAGDGVPALWRVSDVAKAPAIQTTLTLSSRDTQDKKGRRSILAGNAFYVDETSGSPVMNRIPMKLEAVMPLGMPSALAEDYLRVLLRTASHTLIVSAIGGGYAPRG